MCSPSLYPSPLVRTLSLSKIYILITRPGEPSEINSTAIGRLNWESTGKALSISCYWFISLAPATLLLQTNSYHFAPFEQRSRDLVIFDRSSQQGLGYEGHRERRNIKCGRSSRGMMGPYIPLPSVVKPVSATCSHTAFHLVLLLFFVFYFFIIESRFAYSRVKMICELSSLMKHQAGCFYGISGALLHCWAFLALTSQEPQQMSSSTLHECPNQPHHSTPKVSVFWMSPGPRHDKPQVWGSQWNRGANWEGIEQVIVCSIQSWQVKWSGQQPLQKNSKPFKGSVT